MGPAGPSLPTSGFRHGRSGAGARSCVPACHGAHAAAGAREWPMRWALLGLFAAACSTPTEVGQAPPADGVPSEILYAGPRVSHHTLPTGLKVALHQTDGEPQFSLTL